MSDKKEIENKVKAIIEEESLEAFIDHNVKYEFHHICNEVKTVFIFELPDTEVPVEFSMVKNLENRLKELNSRYSVGIFYQGKK